ncbi:hypothetical protein NEOLEDRAFT_1073456 [Neolentinus lepideus HHB14362 ss-1]|uniref:Uncharacterized protein n=1 Tax=Neolentinus lepideus HHB14362 ss-1 TaxID=1314782 RepID=A0A165PSD7_9AGAM|nr:hypothetical protein NEOLEDRAFT_1073456 [Neolentinus lepideus HHB14362 ss-1]
MTVPGWPPTQRGPVPVYPSPEPPYPYQSNAYRRNSYPTQDHQARRRYGPYPNVALATGLGGPSVSYFRPEPDWRPSWGFFQLMAFRGARSASVMIKPDWDDEQLLRELSKTYNQLRSWRRVFSLKTFRYVHLASPSCIPVHQADANYVYPQFARYATESTSMSNNMRIRYYLRHPRALQGKTEFMQYLTRDTRYGVMYLERWDPYRISLLISVPVLATMVFSILWAYFTGNISDAFTIGSYMVTAYSTFLVLIGILNWVEF